jgi:DNA-binding NtrC family response regulator
MAVILIVEDEFFIRQSAEWIIEDLGHDCLIASDLAGALLHIESSARIDALFVDIRLATLAEGGFDIADRAVKARPGLRVLYTSGSPLCQEISRRFVDGGRFLQKPYSYERLEMSLNDLLAAALPDIAG